MSQRQMVQRTGVYRQCIGVGGCGGRGWVRGPGGAKMSHERCGGDGWIRTGSRQLGTGRPQEGRRGGGRAGRTAMVVGGVWLAAGVWLGTAGVVLVGMVVALVAALVLYRAVTRGGARR